LKTTAQESTRKDKTRQEEDKKRTEDKTRRDEKTKEQKTRPKNDFCYTKIYFCQKTYVLFLQNQKPQCKLNVISLRPMSSNTKAKQSKIDHEPLHACLET
jgi:hypothetical protein